MAKITNSLGGLSGGSGEQDNIFRPKYIILHNIEPTLENTVNALNSMTPFTINEITLPIFIVFHLTNNGVRFYKYLLTNRGKGTYGNGGVELTVDDLELIEYDKPTIDDIINLESTEIINLGDIGDSTVWDYINTANPAYEIQDQSEGYTIINAIINGETVSYLFLAPGGTYGDGELQSTEEDYQLLSNVASESLQDLQSVLDQGGNYLGVNDTEGTAVEINPEILYFNKGSLTENLITSSEFQLQKDSVVTGTYLKNEDENIAFNNYLSLSSSPESIVDLYTNLFVQKVFGESHLYSTSIRFGFKNPKLLTEESVIQYYTLPDRVENINATIPVRVNGQFADTKGDINISSSSLATEIINYGTIEVSDDPINTGKYQIEVEDWVVLIGNTETEESPNPQIINYIEPSSEDNYRIDRIEIGPDGDVKHGYGEEDPVYAVPPNSNFENGYITIGYISWYGEKFEVEPVKFGFITKISRQANIIQKAGVIDNLPRTQKANYFLKTEVSEIRGLSFSESSPSNDLNYEGQEGWIYNGSSVPTTIKHNHVSGEYKFKIATNTDYVLFPGEIVHYVFYPSLGGVFIYDRTPTIQEVLNQDNVVVDKVLSFYDSATGTSIGINGFGSMQLQSSGEQVSIFPFGINILETSTYGGSSLLTSGLSVSDGVMSQTNVDHTNLYTSNSYLGTGIGIYGGTEPKMIFIHDNNYFYIEVPTGGIGNETGVKLPAMATGQKNVLPISVSINEDAPLYADVNGNIKLPKVPKVIYSNTEYGSEILGTGNQIIHSFKFSPDTFPTKPGDKITVRVSMTKTGTSDSIPSYFYHNTSESLTGAQQLAQTTNGTGTRGPFMERTFELQEDGYIDMVASGNNAATDKTSNTSPRSRLQIWDYDGDNYIMFVVNRGGTSDTLYPAGYSVILE